MLNFKILYGRVSEVSEEFPVSGEWNGWENRNDWPTMAHAEKRAAEATQITGDIYLAIDRTASTSPRYDVIRAPKVGDEVSYAFNGDYYPDGKIVRVSKSLRVVSTDAGHTYYRRGLTGQWVQTGGTWTMVPGHINRRNPSF